MLPALFVARAASAAHFPTLALPEVIVTGRANVGKSSLLNAVLGRNSLLPISKKAGRTRQFNFYRVSPRPGGNLVLVDAPGYGRRGRPEWGHMLDEYLKSRKQLCRVYILFNAKHGLNAYDNEMLAHLSRLMTASPTQPWTIQSVITKADTIPVDQISPIINTMTQQIRTAAPLCLRPIVTSAQMSPPYGIDQLRKNITDACGIHTVRISDILPSI